MIFRKSLFAQKGLKGVVVQIACAYGGFLSYNSGGRGISQYAKLILIYKSVILKEHIHTNTNKHNNTSNRQSQPEY